MVKDKQTPNLMDHKESPRPILRYPDSYRLRYTNPIAKTHGVAYGPILEKIEAQRDLISHSFTWYLEKGNEVSGWTLLETNEAISKL